MYDDDDDQSLFSQGESPQSPRLLNDGWRFQTYNNYLKL